MQQVERLEPGHDDRDAMAGRDRLVVPVARDRAHVARGQQPVDARVLAAEQGLERGGHQHVRDQHREVREALGFRAVHCHGVGRCRRLEADREEHDLALGALARESERVERRVDDAHVPAARLHLEQVVARAGHAQHVAEGAERDVGSRGDRDRAVDELERRHAHRAARAVDELHRVGQQLVHPELEDRVGLAAAHLHERPAACRGVADPPNHGGNRLGVAVLVDVAHHAASPPGGSSAGVSSSAPISASVRSVSIAACSSMRERAKPTCTST